ncbi:MAG TPA: site-2 protease family protein [Acidimicrobiales bacterium]|nr:site-2 protease family protein [Acidimicrobiales bacterium]
MPGSVRIGRILGVPVAIHWSLLAIGGLLSFDLATSGLPSAHPGHADWAYWAVAAATSIVFFAAVLAHEVGHAVVARRYGVGVEGIDLWLLGGMARLSDEAPSPKAEWRIAVAGPLVSILATIVFIGAAIGLNVTGHSGLISAGLGWLGVVNGILAVFNLLPAAPLDGGRILAAVLWRRHGDRLRAAETAAQAGQFLGWALIAWGLVGFLYGTGNLFTAFIGWFLLTAARQDAFAARARAALAGLTVKDAAWFGIARAGASTDAATMLWERARMGDVGLVAVERPDHSVQGIVTERQLWRVPDGIMGVTPLARIATPIDRFGRATPDEPLVRALTRIHPLNPLLTVWDSGRLVGVVTPQAIQRRVGPQTPDVESLTQA